MSLLRYDVLFARLAEIGLTRDDMVSLERLNDQKIREEVGEILLSQSKKDDVILYFEAWLRILERENPETENAPKEKIQYVSVSDSIITEAKEILKNQTAKN